LPFRALRLGYLVLPPALAEPFARRQALELRHLEVGTQAVMAEFIAAGHFQRHVRRMRQVARSRRDTLLKAWPQTIPGCSPLPAVEAGLHLSIEVATRAREHELIAAARAADIEMNPLSDYWLPGSETPEDARAGLVLGFAAVPEAQIVEALQQLRRAWRL
jgi:GntR family transcriptional regulator/MocR family aminotransferase